MSYVVCMQLDRQSCVSVLHKAKGNELGNKLSRDPHLPSLVSCHLATQCRVITLALITHN